MVQMSPKLDPSSPHTGKRTSVVIARVVGILCVAGGFILGIQGLETPNSPWLPTALGLITAGLVAQVFALVRSWYLLMNRTE